VPDEQESFRTQVLLSIQRAPWDMVTPDLVAVAVGWQSGVISARFGYDGPATEDRRAIVNEVETYVIADFPPDTPTDFAVRNSADSDSRNFEGDEAWWAYRRHDP
jgi:hypothetical protein